MNEPVKMGPSPLRMILAFTLFIATLSTVLFFAMTTIEEHPLDTVKNKRPLPEGEPYFYKSIGQAPIASLDEATPAAMRVPHESFTLEFSVMTNREDAEKLIDKLATLNIEAYYTPLSSGGRIVYRVRQGLFTNAKQAQQASLTLRKAKNVETKVVKL